MAKVTCAVCAKDGDSEKMYYCSKCTLWVHFDCGGGKVHIFSHDDPKCPSCGKRLSK